LATVLAANTGTPLWVQVKLGGTGETLPERVEITSVPYALVCSDAFTVQGHPASDFATSGHSHTWASITGKPSWLSDDLVSWSEVQSKPTSFPPEAHDHDGRYYTETESDGLYLGKTATAADSSKLNGQSASYYSVSGHTHDDRYFTETELNPAQTGGGSLDGRYYQQSVADSTFALIATVQALQQQLNDLKAAWCPPDYQKVTDASIVATGYYCKRGNDEMVKVGDFWVDRYENIIVDNTKYNGGGCDGSSGTVYAQASDPGASGWDGYGFPQTGNWTTRLYACSVVGVTPSRWMTWFQAQQACQASGKELITDAQWQGAAAMATANIQDCNTGASGSDGYNGSDPEATGSMNGPGSTGCISRYGAFDMVGNLCEWTTLWTVAGEKASGWSGWTDGMESTTSPWPSGTGQDYGGDKTWNLAGRAYNGTAYVDGAPAAALRGGDWSLGAQAGVFALYLNRAPSYWTDRIGFRCARK